MGNSLLPKFILQKTSIFKSYTCTYMYVFIKLKLKEMGNSFEQRFILHKLFIIKSYRCTYQLKPQKMVVIFYVGYVLMYSSEICLKTQ